MNDTEERNNDFLIDTRKRKTTSGKNDAHQLNPARITASKDAEETTFKERRFQHREQHARNTNASRNETQTVKKRQQALSRHGNRNNDVTNYASQIKAEDLRKSNRIL